MKTCIKCKAEFEVADEDRKFLEDISPIFNGKKYLVPEPTKCPACRQQQRLAFRNLRSLYTRKCDLTGKVMISTYDKDCGKPVYCSEVWWGDSWNGLDYGRDFDFERPFFEQFEELHKEVPVLHYSVLLCENCDYINGAGKCKNCYLSFNMDYCENCYYLTDGQHCLSCMDSYELVKCELCYESVACENSYNLKYSRRCISCADSYFLADCRRCKNCIGCVNLVGKEYYIYNKPVTPAEFEAFKKTLSSRGKVAEVKKTFEESMLKLPKKFYIGHSNENSSGDRIKNTKNSFHCFDAFNIENCKYCYYLFDAKNCMDLDIFGDTAEWLYNCVTTGTNCSNNMFCRHVWNGSSNNLYCDLVIGSNNCFGCCSLKRQQYCILNKQYTKEEYEELVPKIIEHMKKTGEYGEFFPGSMLPFGYNETQAYEFYPLEKEEALKQGFNWKEKEESSPNVEKMIDGNDMPDTIEDVSDEVIDQVIKCAATGKPFRIIPQELKFYRENGLPAPKLHPEERYKLREKLLNKRKLHDRQCAKCSASIQTSYAPSQPEIVYCEECYLGEVY
ncbi:hypothetical protein HOG48_04165 [Candidatus Peregrinibacteria bacterium]|jgi:hypothetical protein|nr:hypothetical protein [Candidatus Peregrinibacteria bacterium]